MTVADFSVLKWRFDDPATGDSYVFNISPNDQTTPFPKRAITSSATTAPTGQILMFEGARPAAEWSFTGVTLTADQYEALRHWVYDKRNRIVVTDHFGRKITCVLVSFEPVPGRRSLGRYWRHDYTVSALVVNVAAPTVGEKWS